MNRFTTFFWPFADYRDVNRGSFLERSAALRYNRELAQGLPAYLNRWGKLSAVLLILTQLAPPGRTAALLGVLFTLSFCAVAHIAHVWLLLRRLS
ncbi:MAG: hypothetical protein M3N97_14590 [Pseudomonadota bacterium]|nr:hypothetical protein [Pseudomonadota bacterium]